MTQLSKKYHTKMKAYNQRKRCRCCSSSSTASDTTARPPSTIHDNNNVDPRSDFFNSGLSDIPHCYAISEPPQPPPRNHVCDVPSSRMRLTTVIRPPPPPPPTLLLTTTALIITIMALVANQLQQPLPHFFCDSFTVSLKQHPVRASRNGIAFRRTAVPPEMAKDLLVDAPNSSSSSAMKRKGSTKSARPSNNATTKQKRDGRKRMSAKEEYHFYDSMMNHELLTKTQESELTILYHTAKELQQQINMILIQKQKDIFTDIDDRENFVLNELGMNDFDTDVDDNDDDDSDQWDELYLYSGSRDSPDTRTRRKTASTSIYTLYSDEDTNPESMNSQLLLERFHQSSRATMASLLLDTSKAMDDDDDNELNYVGSVDEEFLFDTFSTTKSQQRNFVDQRSSSLSIRLLTEQDIVERLDVPGGRQEMEHILLNGAQARDTLIRCNLRLVQSICKKWARLTYGQKGRGNVPYDLYNGSWDRPSLREAMQEGIIGLTTAVEKFDPARGLRFSTYATNWIINSVRQCYQRSSTGCLKLPTAYYDTRSRLRTLVRQYYDMDGYVPSIDVLAAEMGLSKRRLQLTLRLTRPLLSLDARVTTFARPGQAGSVSGVESSQISDTIADNSIGNSPMDRVELSFLRQQLEHAMAVELIPFERDVLRLRLGLDDGVARTCREVAVMCGGRLKWSAIYNVEKRALRKLRSPVALATYKFLSFLDFADVDMKTITLT